MLIDEELTLKKLEVFLAFMRTGNLARAAAELQTSNVSVHRAIHSLESALRCPLFKHEGRNLTPLESAYVLEERAQKLIQDVVESVRLTREAAGFSAERFKLGSLYSLTVKTVPQLIMGLKIRRSELNIDLIMGSNIDLLYKLKNMEVDAILVSLDDSVNDPDCEHIALFSDDIFLATPADSPFAQRTEVDLAEVRDETFITLTQGFATHQDGVRVFKQAGFEPKVAMQVNDIFTLLSMVSSGVGYALLPGRIAAVYENRVKLIPLQEKYRLQQHIGVVFLKAKERDPNLLALLAECRMYANRHPKQCRLTDNSANNEVEQRRPQQAPKPGMEGRRQRAIRHQPPIRRRQACRHAAHRTGQTTEHHGRAWVIQAHPASRHGSADHDDDRLDQAGRNGQRHHIRRGANRRTSHRPDNVGHRARADGGHADRIAIPEHPGNACADDERQDRAQQQRDGPDHPGLFRFGGLHLERRGDDGEVPQHGAAHQANAGKQRQVRQAFLPASHGSAHPGQHQADDNGNCRAMDPPIGQALGQHHRHPHDYADEGKRRDQAVMFQAALYEIPHISGLLLACQAA